MTMTTITAQRTVRERINGWGKPLLTMLIPLLALAAAWGALKSDVRHVQDDVRSRASNEVVQLQYQTLLREIQQLRADLERRGAR